MQFHKLFTPFFVYYITVIIFFSCPNCRKVEKPTLMLQQRTEEGNTVKEEWGRDWWHLQK